MTISKMEIAPPTNTPPLQYTPPAPAPAPAAPKKRGEAMDIRPKVVTLIRRQYLSLFKEKVKKHNQRLTGSTVVDDWHRMTSDQIYALIKAGMPPFENITLSAGMRKANLGAINRVFLNHYHVKLKKAGASGASGDTMLLHQDAMKIIESLRELHVANTGRELFKLEMVDDIQQWVDQSKNYQTVVKSMWDKLTEEKCARWNEKAKQVDVAGDQSRLIVALPILFKALAAAGHIGLLEAMVLLSYHDEQQVVHTKHLYTILIDYSGTQYNGSEIPWEKINTEPLSFYNKQKFKLPFPLSDSQAMSGGKAMALAEYFQEQGSVFRFQQPSACPPATASVASTSGSAITPAHPIPSASTEGSKDTATPVATATAPTIGLTSGSECALTPVDATANGSTGDSNAPTIPVATSSIELIPKVERAITPLAVSYPLTLGSTSTATGQAAPASPAPPTPPMPSTSGTGSLAASPIGLASLTSKALVTSGGRKGSVAEAWRSNRVCPTAKAKTGTSEEAGLSGTTAPPKGKKQSRFWTYKTVLVDGPAEMTMDEGAMGTSRKRGRLAKNGEGMEDTNGLQAARKTPLAASMMYQTREILHFSGYIRMHDLPSPIKYPQVQVGPTTPGPHHMPHTTPATCLLLPPAVTAILPPSRLLRLEMPSRLHHPSRHQSPSPRSPAPVLFPRCPAHHFQQG
ncbi:hypothetical protein BT96DRAFT_1002525 [Gymnopus androsaceus JB14]|uniref:Uncharacterized protein n=1 Tax=Gymnopus androsaceus JB14 TaxID=1447944 RepID=A0A6A4GXY3_9AGAR|nr:hypothetical protein BT96DRAFT_1002525 [Gymnopus androsaceus JB14]